MALIEVIGLETDGPIKEYCKARNIESLPFSSSAYEIYDNTFPRIRIQDLYKLVEDAGLARRAFEKIPVFLYGSGMFHYISHGLLKKVVDPNLVKLSKKDSDATYSIVLIDNHSDYGVREEEKPGSNSAAIDCGTHVRDSFFMEDTRCLASNVLSLTYQREYPSITKLVRDDSFYPSQEDWSHLTDEYVISEWQRNRKISREDIKRISDAPELVSMMIKGCDPSVYLTIDIDVLSKLYVDINSFEKDYHQGYMPLDDLLFVVDKLMKSQKVIGVDICGMTPDPRAGRIYDSILRVIRGE